MKLSKKQREFINLLLTTDQPQGKMALCTPDGFCCLGLWSVHEGLPLEPCTYGYEIGDENAVFRGGNQSILDPYLTMELGLYSNNGEPKGGRNPDFPAIAVMNDNGMSFREIAKFIVEHKELYFKPQP